MISLLVAGFIFYLYAPHLLFKFAAAAEYDLITRKEIPQVEEFFAAGLPGLLLNVQAALLFRAACLLFPLTPVAVDWSAVASVFQKDPDLSSYVKSANIRALITYAAVLGITSWIAGWAYGRLLRRIALAGGRSEYLRQPQLRSAFLRFLSLVLRGLGILNSRFWDTFYAQYQQPFYPVILRNSYAFVHTTSNLFHGIVYSADKRRDGDIDGIVLVRVSKFSRGRDVELVRAGRNPITDLTGPLFIKWSEITDINYPPDASILATKRAEYDDQIAKYSTRRRSRRALMRRLTSARAQNFQPRKP